MSDRTKKFLLQEKDIPTAWYNVVADMKNKPLPPLNPATNKPLTVAVLRALNTTEAAKPDLHA